MAYIVDPTNPLSPTNTQGATQGAEELRALKAYIAGITGVPPGTPFLQQNLLINPNWQIDQINEGGLYTINSGAGIQGPDGWTGYATTGIFKLRTLVDPDNAALKCLEITCTTADAAPAAGAHYGIATAIEGYDAAALMSGTAFAQQITIQFKFKTSLIGTYGVSIRNSALNRSYTGVIVVADIAEHEYVVKLTLDTAGVWLYTNGVGIIFELSLYAGATFQTPANVWTAGNFV